MPGFSRCYTAASVGNTQPGNTKTPGWHLSARASAFARSTPRRIRSFSMAEIVACEIPVSCDGSFWLRALEFPNYADRLAD
jgi:hypothetical protein